MRWSARLKAGLVAVVLVSVATLRLATGAGAHALRISSAPDNGAVLKAGPPDVTVTFSEEPDPALSSIRVLDSSGATHQKGKPTAVPGQSASLRVALGPLANGVYNVTWQTVSHVDGHLASGSFAFGVGVAPAAGTPKAAVTSSPEPSWTAITSRWLMYAGVMALFGLGVFRLLAIDRSLPRLRAMAVVGWVLAAAGVVGITEAARSAAGVPLSRLLSSSLGHQFLLRGIPTAHASRLRKGPRPVALTEEAVFRAQMTSWVPARL